MKRLMITLAVIIGCVACRREHIYDVTDSNYTISYNIVNNYPPTLKEGKRVWWQDPDFKHVGWVYVIEQTSEQTATVRTANDETTTFTAQRKHLFDNALNHIKLQIYDTKGSHKGWKSYEPAMTYMQPVPGRFYLYGVTAGDYNFIAYTDLNNATKVTYPEKLNLITAETSVMSNSNTTVVAAPSHIYVSSLKTHLPYVSDTMHNVHFELSSPVEEWTLIIHGIKNLNYAKSISFILTNQYKDILLATHEREGNAAISFSGTITSDYKDINTRFLTFGMIPGQTYILQAVIDDGAGYVHRQSFDITALVERNNGQNLIEFSWDLELDTLVAGGLQPGTKEWDEEKEETIIS